MCKIISPMQFSLGVRFSFLLPDVIEYHTVNRVIVLMRLYQFRNTYKILKLISFKNIRT